MVGGVIMASLMLIREILVFCLLLLDSWLFVTIGADEKVGSLTVPLSPGPSLLPAIDDHSDIPKAGFLGDS
jgi:hypothetical protein